MAVNKDNTNHDKLIEDYLFSGYQPNTYESSFDKDQQFAKPIEDEDMFGSLEYAKSHESNIGTQSRLNLLREKYKELAKGLVPKKFAADCDDDNMIDIEIDVTPAQSDEKSNVQSIFRKAAIRKVKDQYGLYKGQKLFWDKYNDYLQKRISADKRKQWDSLHRSLDKYDDEEELIGGKESDDPRQDGEEDEENELSQMEDDEMSDDRGVFDEEDGDDDGDENDDFDENEDGDENDGVGDDDADSESKSVVDEEVADDKDSKNEGEFGGSGHRSEESECRMRPKWIDDDDDDVDDYQKDGEGNKVEKCDSFKGFTQRSPREHSGSEGSESEDDADKAENVSGMTVDEGEFESESDFNSDSNSNLID